MRYGNNTLLVMKLLNLVSQVNFLVLQVRDGIGKLEILWGHTKDTNMTYKRCLQQICGSIIVHTVHIIVIILLQGNKTTVLVYRSITQGFCR